MSDPTILLLAGEESGDLHGAGVARALRERLPGARLLGLGGERMAAEGVELMENLDRLAVMGFAEVLGRLPFFWRLEGRIRSLLRSGRVDLVLPIDYPGLNLRLATASHAAGVPVLYYISPQVWAWRAGRARKLAAAADHVAVILPFEVEILEEAGARVTFVGHPLLEEELAIPAREEFLRGLGLDPDRPVLAIFPGSRRQEIGRHLQVFLAAGDRVREAEPEVQVVVARASSIPVGLLEEAMEDRPWVRVTGEGRALLRHGRAALVKSGTTTLEAALAGIPFVTAYRTSRLTYLLARRLVRVDHIALANLVAGRRVVPELVQGEATPDALSNRLLPFVRDSAERRQVTEGLATVRRALGSPGASARVAELASGILEERRQGRSTARGGA